MALKHPTKDPCALPAQGETPSRHRTGGAGGALWYREVASSEPPHILKSRSGAGAEEPTR